MSPNPLVRLRKMCLAFPEAHEVEAWGEPTFRVRNKQFAMFAGKTDHHGNGRNAVWLDEKTDWKALVEILETGYRSTAPEKLLLQPVEKVS